MSILTVVGKTFDELILNSPENILLEVCLVLHRSDTFETSISFSQVFVSVLEHLVYELNAEEEKLHIFSFVEELTIYVLRKAYSFIIMYLHSCSEDIHTMVHNL